MQCVPPSVTTRARPRSSSLRGHSATDGRTLDGFLERRSCALQAVVALHRKEVGVTNNKIR